VVRARQHISEHIEIKFNMEKIMKITIPPGIETLYLGLRPDTVKGPGNKYVTFSVMFCHVFRYWLISVMFFPLSR